MSDNRPEWQPGADPAGTDNAADSGQYASGSSAADPGAQEGQDNTAYPSYGQQEGQQDSNPYGQQDSNPYGQQDSNPYGQQNTNPYGQQNTNPYAQQDAAPAQQASYPGYGQEGSAYSQPAGYPAYGQGGYPQPQANPGQAMGIAGLITSFFFSVVGLVLSIVGLNQSRKAGMGNTPAVIGIIVGGLGTLFGALMLIFIIVAMSAPSGY
ncbi:DUF4190 domain-containing protein [Arthrobacter zhaoxinii]|uniref:DUF4190 domain-containing protein n=1 Tax=Arthrobacter zhaoxinii TaxID=2964616 RepID=UPI0021043927|nr:DUF4190 domain-containing protein [Arthrobacter zhaoxinii]MCQ2001309.1 hypothetical protein [Arthrobacter zhaoxinii]